MRENIQDTVTYIVHLEMERFRKTLSTNNVSININANIDIDSCVRCEDSVSGFLKFSCEVICGEDNDNLDNCYGQINVMCYCGVRFKTQDILATLTDDEMYKLLLKVSEDTALPNINECLTKMDLPIVDFSEMKSE